MKQLIKDIKKQKPRAQKKLFDKYADYLYRISFRYLNNKELCEDVLSQSFLLIFNSIAATDITEEIVLKAWMKKIVINQSLMELRKKKIFIDKELDVVNAFDISPDAADAKLLEEDLIKLVLDMPDGYRTVFCLFIIEGYSHEEISNKLCISINTSKSQLRKARCLLRKKILNIEKDYEAVH